ncbi:hypothetical protein LPJ53_004970 [Coemansia erecta]|uniref:Pentacotripeptide-repeat region of PRORP domain-containing protein n=1 Tax=Coemansia erecta TaxID=147472 RepID=A0A9W7XXU1_9FUNG|nr:hypothetical protein LPJ53_004970 [Coemansia erecta]
MKTGSVAQREQIWAFYQRISSEDLSWVTIERVLEVVARDSDHTRAFGRIAQVLTNITGRYDLTESQAANVRRICDELEKPVRATHITRAPVHQGPIRQSGSIPNHGTLTNILPVVSEQTRIKNTHSSSSEDSFGSLIKRPVIELDPQQVWRAYEEDLERHPLSYYYNAVRLVRYAATMGHIGGKRLLIHIENDLARRNPVFLNALRSSLIQAYAHLDCPGDARRCYEAGNRTGHEVRLDWSMCLSLLWSTHHKEAQAMFDKQFVAPGRAIPVMFGKIMARYASLANAQAAYALFDTMKRVDAKPNALCLEKLAQSCALDLDTVRGSRRLAEVVSFMRSWGRSPDTRFLIGLMHGYNKSQQDDMFDMVASKVDVHRAKPTQLLKFWLVTMNNAVRRGQFALAQGMAKRISAEAFRGIPRVVHAMCAIGETCLAKKLAGIDSRRFPDNNITANIRLELKLADTTARSSQLELFVKKMVADGFTPSSGLFGELVKTLHLRGGSELALGAFARLTAIGIPSSVETLLHIMHLRLESSNPSSALSIFDDIRERLGSADLSFLQLHAATGDNLVRTLIEYRGIAGALDAFDFLSSQPVLRSKLPYSTLIEYCLNHRLWDHAHSMVRQIVQRDIALRPEVANQICHYLTLRSTSSDAVNFLRYIQRMGSLGTMSNETLVSAIYCCIETGRMVDLEWVVSALADCGTHVFLWRGLVDCLAPHNTSALLRVVRIVFQTSESKQKTALDFLKSTSGAKYQAVAASMVVQVLREHDQDLTLSVMSRAVSHILETFDTLYKIPRHTQSDSDPILTLPYLVNSLSRFIVPAINGGLNSSMLTRALMLLSYGSGGKHEECLKLLRLIPPEQLDVAFFGAIAQGCARHGLSRGVDAVLGEMRKYHIKPSHKLITTILLGYGRASPPKRHLDRLPEEETSTLALTSLQDTSTSPITHIDKASPGPTELPDDRTDIPDNQSSTEAVAVRRIDGHYTDPAAEFYRAILDRMLHIWGEFEYHNQFRPRAAYSIVVQTCISAGDYARAESMLDDMVSRGVPHDEITALQLISLALRQNDIDEALRIFAAIGRRGSSNRHSRRYFGLKNVERNAEHFSLIVEYYLQNSHIDNAMSLLGEMHGLGLAGPPWLYTLVLKYLARSNMKGPFVQTMRQIAQLRVKVDHEMLDTIKEYTSQLKEPNTD